MLVVEGGQHDAPRPAVEVAVDREQAVAHQADEFPEVAVAPEEVRRMRDEDVVVGGGPEHEHDVAVKHPQGEDGPEALVRLDQHRQGFLGKAPRTSHREAGLSWRKWHRGRALVAEVV